MKHSSWTGRLRRSGRGALLGLLGLVAVACATGHEDPFPDVHRPPTPKTLFALARVLAARGDTGQAAVIYNRLATENPDFAPAYSELAELLVQERRYADAGTVLREGLKHAPNDPVLLNNLGMVHLLAREWGPAVDCFRQAAAARPSEARFQANLALALGMQGDFKQSMAIYERIMPADKAYRNLCIIHQARGDDAPTTAGAGAPPGPPDTARQTR